MSSRSLSDVPEEDSPLVSPQLSALSIPSSPNPSLIRMGSNPYLNPFANSSSSTIQSNTQAQSQGSSSTNAGTNGRSSSRKTPSIRTLGRSSAELLLYTSSASSNPPSSSSSPSVAQAQGQAQAQAQGHSVKRVSSSSSTSASTRIGTSSSRNTRSTSGLPKVRSVPKLPHDKEAESAASTIMHWSRAPVHGTLPMRPMRGHTVTMVDTTAWLFGGSDEKEKDIYCFDTETMQWTQYETAGDHPPPCRAHTSTLVDRKIVVFGGGSGPHYYNAIYVLDTINRRWTRPSIAPGPLPAPRRAHSAVYYHNHLWVFGGGNGLTALNDLWVLDMSNRVHRWEEVQTVGDRPPSRGYHTANVVGNVMVVVGGSDGKECFTDVHCLNLDSMNWTKIKIEPSPEYRRLAHSSTQVGSYLFIIGGNNSVEYRNDILLFNLVSLNYETRVVYGRAPSQRAYHVCALSDSRVFMFGGYNGTTTFDDVHMLDLAASAYLPQVTSFAVEVQ